MPSLIQLPPFDSVRQKLEKQYVNAEYGSGWSKQQLSDAFDNFCAENPDQPRIVQKAEMLRLICENAPIAPEKDDYFVGKVQHYGLLLYLRGRWRYLEAIKEFGCRERLEYFIGDYSAQLDCNSHVCPDWESLLSLGLKGIADRARPLAESSAYHRAVTMVFDALRTLFRRFDEIHPGYGLAEMAERPPKNFREALQFSYIYHEVMEFDGIQIRSMGLFDRLYNPYFVQDLADGTLTKESAAELLKYYWIKLYAKTGGLQFGKPITFGPSANELTYFAFETYGAMKIHDPKFHLRVSKNTQSDFLQLVCRIIRNGSNAIVLVNSDMQEAMLAANGKTPEDAEKYILIGCYEPSVQGMELNCSGAGHLNLSKPVEQAFVEAKDNWTYEDFEKFYFEQLDVNIKLCRNDLRRWERLWPMSHPAPIFSGPMLSCHESGKDISEAGAKYNTTGICCGGLPDAVDSLIAVRELLKRNLVGSIPEIGEILRSNWQGYEILRQTVMHKFPSWGNNIADVDDLAQRIANFAADRINNEPNERGGVFQMALYAITVAAKRFGEKTGALPNGRLAGTILTMNTNCENGRDFNGATAILNSNAKLPMHRFPNGTTLDITLHPSAVSGEKGVDTLKNLLLTYFEQGGSTVQFNIFSKETLLDAQKNPEKYGNLQVRVCGWNLRFVDLAPDEQQIFIDRAAGGDVC